MSNDIFRNTPATAADASTGKTATARRLTLMAAAASLPVATQSTADAADFYNSGPITSNNVVGWVNDTAQLSGFQLSLTNSKVAQFNTRVNFGNYNKDYSISFGAYGQGLSFGGKGGGSIFLETFSAGKKWTTAAGNTLGSGVWGKVQKFIMTGGTTTGGSAFGKTTSDAYLLFKFTDNAEDYYGWVQVGGTSAWNSAIDLNVTVKSYAWQKGSLGVLAAGATAVPEPSTVVTSGIAALTGGAMALRRWRRERKKAATAA